MLPTGAAEALTVESRLSLSLLRPDLCQGPCHTHTCTDPDTHTDKGTRRLCGVRAALVEQVTTTAFRLMVET